MNALTLRSIKYTMSGLSLAGFLVAGHACTPAGQQTAAVIATTLGGIACNVVPVIVTNNGGNAATAGAVCDDVVGTVTGIINAVITAQKASSVALTEVKSENARYAPITLGGRQIGSVRVELQVEVQKRLDAVAKAAK